MKKNHDRRACGSDQEVTSVQGGAGRMGKHTFELGHVSTAAAAKNVIK
jgi:hypothetical protein